MKMIRISRWLAAAMVIIALIGLARQPVLAQPYGDCANVTANYTWATLEWCGPYEYEKPSDW